MELELQSVLRMVLELDQNPNAPTDYIEEKYTIATGKFTKGMGELAYLANYGNAPSRKSKGLGVAAYATLEELNRQLQELIAQHDLMSKKSPCISFILETMARWVAQDTLGRKFEGYKEISLAEVLTLGDASTVAFTPDSKSDADFLKKIDEIVTKIGLRSRAQFWLIRIVLNYLHARIYESIHKKPMPLIMFGAKANKHIVGHIGRYTTSLVASLGDELHPESSFRGGNNACTPARIDELDNTLVQFMGPMLDLPAGSTRTFNQCYGNEMTTEERILWMASKLEIWSKGGKVGGKAQGKIATESADLVRRIMEDEGLTKEEAVEMLPSGKLKSKYESLMKGGRTPWSEETRAKLSGREVSEETRAKLSGREVSKETRAKLSGREVSEETRAKLSANQKGRKHSAEAKAKMSASQKGREVSAEAKAKISASRKGRKHSAETKAKISASHLGKRVEP